MQHTIQTTAINKIEKQKQILKLEELRLEIINTRLNNVDDAAMTKAFSKIGAEIIPERTNVQFRDVVNYFSNNDIVTESDLLNSKMKIEYRLKATTLRPITFNGYTSKGSGRNQDRLNSKAAKLQEKLTALTGYKCYINPFGLEVKNSEEEFAFSVEFFV